MEAEDSESSSVGSSLSSSISSRVSEESNSPCSLKVNNTGCGEDLKNTDLVDASALVKAVCPDVSAVDCLGSDMIPQGFEDLAEVVTEEHLIQLGCVLNEPKCDAFIKQRQWSGAVSRPTSFFGKHMAESPVKWERHLHEASEKAVSEGWKRPYRRGFNMFMTKTVFMGVSAQDLSSFLLDDLYTTSYDKSFSKLKYTCSMSGKDPSEVGHHRRDSTYLSCQTPWPLAYAAREYQMARRTWYRQDGGCYILSCCRPDADKFHVGKGALRLTDFVSGTRVRAMVGSDGRPCAEMVLVYYEDSQFKPGIVNANAKECIVRSLRGKSKALHRYLDASAAQVPRTPPISRQPSVSEVVKEIGPPAVISKQCATAGPSDWVMKGVLDVLQQVCWPWGLVPIDFLSMVAGAIDLKTLMAPCTHVLRGAIGLRPALTQVAGWMVGMVQGCFRRSSGAHVKSYPLELESDLLWDDDDEDTESESSSWSTPSSDEQVVRGVLQHICREPLLSSSLRGRISRWLRRRKRVGHSSGRLSTEGICPARDQIKRSPSGRGYGRFPRLSVIVGKVLHVVAVIHIMKHVDKEVVADSIRPKRRLRTALGSVVSRYLVD